MKLKIFILTVVLTNLIVTAVVYKIITDLLWKDVNDGYEMVLVSDKTILKKT